MRKIGKVLFFKIIYICLVVCVMTDTTGYAMPNLRPYLIFKEGKEYNKKKMKQSNPISSISSVPRDILEIEWISRVEPELENRVNELVQLNEIAQLFKARGNNKLFIKMDKGIKIIAGIDWYSKNHGQDFTLLINPNFINHDYKAQKIILKHEGCHVKYFDSEKRKQSRNLMDSIGYLFLMGRGPKKVQKKLENIVHTLDHIDLFRRAIEGGDEDVILEDVDLDIDYLEMGEEAYLGRNDVEAWKNIFDFSDMYAYCVVPFLLVGDYNKARKIEQKLRQMYFMKGYKDYDMDAGVELVRQLMGKIEHGKFFPGLGSILDTFGLENVLRIRSNI